MPTNLNQLSNDIIWKRIIDNSPANIFIVDNDHKIIYMNNAMHKCINMDKKDISTKHCFQCIHTSDCVIEGCVHDKMIIDQKLHNLEFFDEKLGGNIEVSAYPYYSATGEVLGSVHILRNINDRINFIKEKEARQVQLLNANKLESVGQLASGIAHEINTPVQFVASNISFLQDSFEEIINYINKCERIFNNLTEIIEKDSKESILDAKNELDLEFLNAEIPNAIEQSKEGLQRVTSIVQAMKSFSHPGGQEKMENDINQLIDTTITVSRNEWKYVAKIKTEYDKNLSPLWCHINSISQVILNMIVNAAHAIEAKLGKNPTGEKGLITLTTKQYDDHIEIKIADTGSGIPKTIQNKIFDPFFTTKDVGRGTGQGLAIAYDVICIKHNGSIEFETQEGSGTTFILKIPNNS